VLDLDVEVEDASRAERFVLADQAGIFLAEDVVELRGGNGLPPVRALPQLPCLETAERLDCAVDDFSLSTLLPEVALLAVLVLDPGSIPAGPGRIG